MTSIAVDKLPPCTECQANDVTPPLEANHQVINPMKQKMRLCSAHFDAYIEQRLGPGMVAEFVLTRKAGGR